MKTTTTQAYDAAFERYRQRRQDAEHPALIPLAPWITSSSENPLARENHQGTIPLRWLGWWLLVPLGCALRTALEAARHLDELRRARKKQVTAATWPARKFSFSSFAMIIPRKSGDYF